MNFGKTFLKEVAEDPVYPILRLVSGKKMVLRCMKIFVGGGGIMATLGANGLGSPMGDFGEFGKLLWLCVCVSSTRVYLRSKCKKVGGAKRKSPAPIGEFPRRSSDFFPSVPNYWRALSLERKPL